MKEKIRTAMDEIQKKTCVRFLPQTKEKNFIIYESHVGCHSHLGMTGGMQSVSLSKGCFRIGTIMHETIHALGYSHMHNHFERDKFVKINWNNISPGHEHNFMKVNPKYFDNFGTSYDYSSVMHYSAGEFTKGPKLLTIVPLNSKYMSVIGQRKQLSPGDVKRINNMYNC